MAKLVQPLRDKQMKPFPDSLQISLESAERLQSRHPERYDPRLDHDPTKFDMFGRPI